MDYMTLVSVIEDLNSISNMADVERLLIKYELEADSIEQQISEQYQAELDSEYDYFAD